ncbi:UNVERIFIED_CONTAM: DNA primase (bacterial type) [Acetivibrio alkalicellulosi]
MLKEKLRFDNDQISRANSVNIIEYCKNRGYNIRQVSRHSFKIPDYGGLYISSDGQKWNCFSQNKGGGVIQFVMEIENKSWVEAVKELLNIRHDDVKYVSRKVVKHEKKEEEFILPERNSTYKHIFAYLIGTRGIEKEIIYDFVKKDKIFENKYGSCIFVGYDKLGKARYASVRSTNTIGKSYRGDVKNSDKSYPFCLEGRNDTVCLFESPIDLMSYLTLIKMYNIKNFENHCISLGGVSDKALEYYLKQYPDIKKIMFCLDNDEAGHFSCNQIAEKYKDRYDILRHLPKRKDFNEDLIEFIKEKEQLDYSKVNEPYEL